MPTIVIRNMQYTGRWHPGKGEKTSGTSGMGKFGKLLKNSSDKRSVAEFSCGKEDLDFIKRTCGKFRINWKFRIKCIENTVNKKKNVEVKEIVDGKKIKNDGKTIDGNGIIELGIESDNEQTYFKLIEHLREKEQYFYWHYFLIERAKGKTLSDMFEPLNGTTDEYSEEKSGVKGRKQFKNETKPQDFAISKESWDALERTKKYIGEDKT